MAKEQLKRTILTPVVKRTTGVYQIRCSDGRLYIGSSVDIRSRWSQHLQKLQRDSHSNWRLQQAWNKVNTTFEFSVLEVTDRDQLFAVEQKWIEETRCTDLELGFNIFDIAGSPGGRSRSNMQPSRLDAYQWSTTPGRKNISRFRESSWRSYTYHKLEKLLS